jgi:hypothetical protein
MPKDESAVGNSERRHHGIVTLVRLGLLLSLGHFLFTSVAGAQLLPFGGTNHPFLDSTGVWLGDRAKLSKSRISATRGRLAGRLLSVSSGTWDGAQMELITSDPIAVYIPHPPGHENAIALTASGQVYVVYRRLLESKQQSDVYFMYRSEGGSWSEEVRLPMQTCRIPHAGIVVTPNDDTPHFFFLEGDFLWSSYIVHGTYDTLAQHWQVDTVACTERRYWHTGATFAIDGDSLGGLHVVWDDLVWNEEYQQEVDRVTYAENTTGVWRTQVIADIGFTSRIQVEPNGRAHIKYGVRRDDHNFVIVAVNRFRGDDVWMADSTDLAPKRFSSKYFRRARDGTYHMSMAILGCPPPWCFTYAMYYTRRSPGETGWEEPVEVFYPSASGLLRLDCRGQVHFIDFHADPENIGAYPHYFNNIWGVWAPRYMEFAEFGPLDAGIPPYFIDGSGRGHAVVWVYEFGGEDWLYYYSSPAVVFDVLDLCQVIDHVYLGASLCYPNAYDRNCDGPIDVADFQILVNYLFAGGPRGCE